MATAPKDVPRTQTVQTEPMPYPPSPYAWYVVTLLTLTYVFSFIDRQILSLLVGPIKADLGITDTQMSLLMGFSFAVFYTFFGIPLGRLADSRSRRGIIAVGLIFWSFASAGCGLARQYWQLLFMRMGVGVGEAALSPSAYSLITDYFPPRRLALAISLYGMGIYLGSGMAVFLGGYVVKFATAHPGFELPILGMVKPWQLVFFAVGLPGILFSLILFTIKEPMRRSLVGAGGVQRAYAPVPFSEVLRYIRQNWSCFACHNFGFGFLAFVSYACASWVPEYFRRVHGWTPGDTGIRYGTLVMICGSAGILFGGYLADRLTQRGHRDAKMRAGYYAAVAAIPLAVLFPLMPNPWVALAMLALSTFALAMPFGVAPAAMQEMMPASMRGQASAVYLFVVNLIGMGMGPTAVALFTDKVFMDESKIGLSLMAANSIGAITAALFLGFGLSHFRQSMNYLNTWHEEQV